MKLEGAIQANYSLAIGTQASGAHILLLPMHSSSLP